MIGFCIFPHDNHLGPFIIIIMIRIIISFESKYIRRKYSSTFYLKRQHLLPQASNDLECMLCMDMIIIIIIKPTSGRIWKKEKLQYSLVCEPHILGPPGRPSKRWPTQQWCDGGFYTEKQKRYNIHSRIDGPSPVYWPDYYINNNNNISKSIKKVECSFHPKLAQFPVLVLSARCPRDISLASNISDHRVNQWAEQESFQIIAPRFRWSSQSEKQTYTHCWDLCPSRTNETRWVPQTPILSYLI